MTTLEQAARQALEALDGLIPYLFLTDETRWGQYYKALSALRQALEQPTVKDYLKVDQQPKHEPVAWISKQSLAEIKDFDATVYGRGGFDDAVPLYTEPPKRKPLTDGEIFTAYITATNQTLRPRDERLALAFARAIEGKLKELNA